jgi:hypothetical protein
MKRVYLDNSAVNDLHDDDPGILEAIVSECDLRPIVSELNIVELGSIRDPEDRSCRLTTLSRLMCEFAPLPASRDLLSAHLRAYEGAFDDSELLERAGGLWAILRNPEKGWTDEAQAIADRYRRGQKAWFGPAWREARAHYRREFRRLPEVEKARSIRSVSGLVRLVDSDPVFLRTLIGDMLDQSKKAMEDPNAFLDAVPEWKAFLVGLACALHRRVFREERSGDDFNPGSLDLYQLAYLPHCDVFVTSDKALRIVARMPCAMLENRPEPMSYHRFRLLVGSPFGQCSTRRLP